VETLTVAGNFKMAAILKKITIKNKKPLFLLLFKNPDENFYYFLLGLNDGKNYCGK